MSSADSRDREIAVTKYFRRTPEKPSYIGNILLIIVGILLIAFGVANINIKIVLINSSWFLGSGIVLALLGFIFFMSQKNTYDEAYRYAEPKPSDEQMDIWFSEDKTKIINEALKKLGLEDIKEENRVLNADKPLFMPNIGNSAKFKKGKDGIFRFSSYRIVVIYLTNYNFGAYSCNLDFIKGETNDVQTQEYYYIDVVSVSTFTVKSDLKFTDIDGNKHIIDSYQEFSFSVANGESIKATFHFPQLEKIDVFKEGRFPASDAEKAINIIRKMLRDKKGGSEKPPNS